MIAYWVNFARTSDPNGPGLERWPRYNEDRQYLSLVAENSGLLDETFLDRAHGISAFWERLPDLGAQPSSAS